MDFLEKNNVILEVKVTYEILDPPPGWGVELDLATTLYF